MELTGSPFYLFRLKDGAWDFDFPISVPLSGALMALDFEFGTRVVMSMDLQLPGYLKDQTYNVWAWTYLCMELKSHEIIILKKAKI